MQNPGEFDKDTSLDIDLIILIHGDRRFLYAEFFRKFFLRHQMDLFTDYDALNREKRLHAALLEARTRYGANALLKGTNLLEGATTIERNKQIGGHRA